MKTRLWKQQHLNISFFLRPKVTYAGKAIKLKKERFNPVITTVRSVMYVPN